MHCDEESFATEKGLMNGREKMYAKGGIFSITSRILVVDLLSSTISGQEESEWG